MILKNISKTKLSLALISLVITFFVWQQGLRDSLNRPSVSFDISQKEQEITELSIQSIPTKLKKFFITNDPVAQINDALSQVPFDELTERNKIIRIISSESNESKIYKNISKEFKNKGYNLLIQEIEKKSNNNARGDRVKKLIWHSWFFVFFFNCNETIGGIQKHHTNYWFVDIARKIYVSANKCRWYSPCK